MNWRRILSVMVVCVLVLAMPVVSQTAAGSDTGVTPRYNYTWIIDANLQISSSGNALCEGGVSVYDASSTISMKVSLYQKVGTSWDRVTSWYSSSTGKDELEISKTYQLTEYGRYKVRVSGTVTSAGGDSEWFSLESDEMIY